MDPNATLAKIRRMIRDEAGTTELVETIRDLVEWIRNGGFPPDGWKGSLVKTLKN